jgi:hypothetical protein
MMVRTSRSIWDRCQIDYIWPELLIEGGIINVKYGIATAISSPAIAATVPKAP